MKMLDYIKMKNALLLSTLLHIGECSRLRHSSIADKENYIFTKPALAICRYAYSAFYFLVFFEEKKRMNGMQCLHLHFGISLFIFIE